MGLLHSSIICEEDHQVVKFALVSDNEEDLHDANVCWNSLLGPGASSLSSALSDPSKDPSEIVDLDRVARDLSLKDWSLIVKAFHEWPFAPEVMSGISGSRAFTDPLVGFGHRVRHGYG